MRTILLLFALVSICACSKRAIYDNLQMQQRERCSRVPPGQYDDCIRQAGMSYDQYERERRSAGGDGDGGGD